LIAARIAPSTAKCGSAAVLDLRRGIEDIPRDTPLWRGHGNVPRAMVNLPDWSPMIRRTLDRESAMAVAVLSSLANTKGSHSWA
jgi:hypothetical protein